VTGNSAPRILKLRHKWE